MTTSTSFRHTAITHHPNAILYSDKLHNYSCIISRHHHHNIRSVPHQTFANHIHTTIPPFYSYSLNHQSQLHLQATLQSSRIITISHCYIIYMAQYYHNHSSRCISTTTTTKHHTTTIPYTSQYHTPNHTVFPSVFVTFQSKLESPSLSGILQST